MAKQVDDTIDRIDKVEMISAIEAVPRLGGGDTDIAFGHVQDLLQRIGYLDRFRRGTLDGATARALARFQRRWGLAVNGNFDGETRRRMTNPQCAVPDLDRSTSFALSCSWTHPCLTYAFGMGTPDVAGPAEFQAVRDAFGTWARATPLTFTEVGLDQHPDVAISWVPGLDPDFDLAGAVAHADFPPGCGIVSDDLPKPVHFNDATINWAIGRLIFSWDVESAALHELGHILGLRHSTVDGSVMTGLPFALVRRQLTADDLVGIRLLYPALLPTEGVVTIRQGRTDRLLDAHEIADKDFRLVTRPTQGNDSQRWILSQVGTVNVIRHRTSGRFLDAFEDGDEDFRLVTRDAKREESQRWVVIPDGQGSATVRQLSSNRLLDAHEIAGRDFAAVTRPAQHNDTQRWDISPVATHVVTMRQRSSGRFLDAHEIADFGVVTRPAQLDQTQHWILAPVGAVFTVRQRSNGRFVDAHEIADRDYAVVTRPDQGDDTQRWVVMAIDGSSTIRQLSSGRFLDAYLAADNDFGVVTRPSRSDPSQQWFIEPVSPRPSRPPRV